MPRPGCFVFCLVEIDSVFLEKIYFMLLGYYLPLEMDIVHNVNILESLWSKDVLWQIWLNLQSRSRVFKLSIYFYCSLLSPLGGLGPSFKETKILFNQGWFVSSLVTGSKASLENGKSFFNGRAMSSSTGRWLLKQLYAKLLQNLLENQGANLNQTCHKAF